MTLFESCAPIARAPQTAAILVCFDDPGPPQEDRCIPAARAGICFFRLFPRAHLEGGAHGASARSLPVARRCTARRGASRGARRSTSEGRAVLHTSARAPGGPILVHGVDVMAVVLETRRRMEAFAMDILVGQIAGAGGPSHEGMTWFNIGIGGSDLGPAMATAFGAGAPIATGPLESITVVERGWARISMTRLRGARPEAHVVIVASKTFTTIETMTNRQDRARLDRGRARRDDPDRSQFAALSSATTRPPSSASIRPVSSASRIGSAGRYSLWGPIGLGLMLAVGPEELSGDFPGMAVMRWTPISARRSWRRTCLCCWR